MVRSIGEVLGACAVFSILFGLAFGEFLGDLGRHWFGLHPLLLDREEALLPFLALALALGLVHIGIGLVLGIVNAARGHPRQAIGRTASLVMLLTLVVALLAAVNVLPGGFFTPAVVVLLAAFPVAFVGTIGFVGLVGPHIARMLIGEDQRFFLPASVMTGALLLSISSVVSKTLIPGAIFPVGVVTSLIGVPRS